MGLKKIIEAYGLSNEFADLMRKFETSDIRYPDIECSIFKDAYERHEKRTEEMMVQNRFEMVAGSILFFLGHPQKMILAQRYYHSAFGKPCRL